MQTVSALTGLIEEIQAKRATAVAPALSASNPPGGPDFATVLEQVAASAADSLRTAEAVSLQGLRGKASTLEVVEAIKDAEQALSTAVAVRDRAVAAYQEISRMAI